MINEYVFPGARVYRSFVEGMEESYKGAKEAVGKYRPKAGELRDGVKPAPIFERAIKGMEEAIDKVYWNKEI